MPLIGVSIAVPAPCGPALQSYRLGIGDEAAALIPTHITLVPPAEVDTIDDIVEELAGAAAVNEPFRVHLRGTGTFRPISPVVFINLAEGISQCELLTQSITAGQLSVNDEFPYHPHVTIAHHLDDESMDRAFRELAGFEGEFEVTSFWLYEYDEAAGWVQRQEFMLGR